MATGGIGNEDSGWNEIFEDNLEEQNNEVLAIESIYGMDGEDRIQVFNRAPTEINKNQQVFHQFNSLRLKIPVETEADDINVNISMPSFTCEEDKQTINNYRRSLSGNSVIGSIRVKYLTPIHLDIELPPEYPSCGPPKFQLSCIWLSGQQLSTLCEALDRLWTENKGLPIIYLWADWLQNQSISCLGIRSHIELNVSSEDSDEIDGRAAPMTCDINSAVTALMRYSIHEEAVQFNRNEHECGFCLLDLPGSEFYRLERCKHFSCRNCMKEYCCHHVKEGTVFELVCPDPECKADIPPYIIKEVLGKEEYERWERLSLEKGLGRMGDVVWCPRCKAVIIKEDDLGHCIICYYSFCTKCYKPWHQGEMCMSPEEEMRDYERKMKAQLEKEIEDEALRQEELEKLMEKRKKEESFSTSYISDNTKPCPKCQRKIEKDGGCNKVTCALCYGSMCWVCGKDITQESYGHFSDNSECNSFAYETMRPVQNPDYNAYWEEIMPTPKPRPSLEFISKKINIGRSSAKTVSCPKCKQRHLPNHDGNNHIKCWNCHSDFCFQCRSFILKGAVTQHFKAPNPCKQHTKHSVPEVT